MIKIIKRIFSATPLQDKIDGIFCTKIGGYCVVALGYLNTYNIKVPTTATVLLIIGAVVFGGKAIIHASKVER